MFLQWGRWLNWCLPLKRDSLKLPNFEVDLEIRIKHWLSLLVNFRIYRLFSFWPLDRWTHRFLEKWVFWVSWLSTEMRVRFFPPRLLERVIPFPLSGLIWYNINFFVPDTEVSDLVSRVMLEPSIVIQVYIQYWFGTGTRLEVGTRCSFLENNLGIATENTIL